MLYVMLQGRLLVLVCVAEKKLWRFNLPLIECIGLKEGFIFLIYLLFAILGDFVLKVNIARGQINNLRLLVIY